MNYRSIMSGETFLMVCRRWIEGLTILDYNQMVINRMNTLFEIPGDLNPREGQSKFIVKILKN
jgi:hypothetical protein